MYSASLDSMIKKNIPRLSVEEERYENDMSGLFPSNPVILLLGHPNCGKTSLFNTLTKARYKTVNYPGSTVEYALGTIKHPAVKSVAAKEPIHIVDTPGITSLFPKTPDEQVTLTTLSSVNRIMSDHHASPDLIIVVIDRLHLARQLVLVSQILKAGIPVIVALSKEDVSEKEGLDVNAPALASLIGTPVFSFSSKTGKGIASLLQEACRCLPRHSDALRRTELREFKKGNPVEEYAWAENIKKLTVRVRPNAGKRLDPDHIILHPVLGPVIFLTLMTGFFWLIFSLAAPFIDAVDTAFAASIAFLNSRLPDMWLTHVFTEGLLAGIGSVLVFTPQIFLLFLAIGLMESSGYLARGAVLVDKPLSAIGMNGRSFVPLLSGCACAIPAMMAARTIPGKRERFLTLFVIPLMTCSARLPVYGLLLALLIRPASPVLTGLAMTGIYFGSITIASVVAAIAGRFMGIHPVDTKGFHMELPAWHRPMFKNVILHAVDQTISFCRKAGPTIAVISIALWVLTQFPSPDHSYISQLGALIEPVLRPMGVDWRVGVALLLSFAAREVFVSALALVFAVDEANTAGFFSALQTATFQNSDQLLFTPATIVGLILFFMISMQCMATLAVARKEMGGWKAPILMGGLYIVLAYIVAVIAVQGLSLVGI